MLPFHWFICVTCHFIGSYVSHDISLVHICHMPFHWFMCVTCAVIISGGGIILFNLFSDIKLLHKCNNIKLPEKKLSFNFQCTTRRTDAPVLLSDEASGSQWDMLPFHWFMWVTCAVIISGIHIIMLIWFSDITLHNCNNTKLPEKKCCLISSVPQGGQTHRYCYLMKQVGPDEANGDITCSFLCRKNAAYELFTDMDIELAEPSPLLQWQVCGVEVYHLEWPLL